MIPAADGAGGLPFPPGDPDAVRAAAAVLRSAARSLGSAVDGAAGHVSAALSAWSGAASDSFAGAAKAVDGGTALIGEGAASLSSVLNAYADALEAAQRLSRQAQQAMAEAEQAFAARMAAADSDLQRAAAAAANSLDGAAAGMEAQAQSAQAAASSQLSAAGASASALANQAMQMAGEAASLAALRVRAVTTEIRSMSLNDWGKAVGGAGVAFEGVSLVGLRMAFSRLLQTRAVLGSGAWDKIAELDPEEWEKVAKFAEQNGEESLATLAKAYEYEVAVGQEAQRGVINAFGGFGKVSTGEGALAAGLDVVGKVGVGVGALGDAITLADGKLPDKIVAGANLTGIAGAAAGTELGGSVAGLLGVESVALWIPVAGQVLIGATALAATGLWVYENWNSVGRWASEAGHDVVAAGEDAVQAYEWLGRQELHAAADVVNTGAHLATAAVDEATSVASSAVGTAEHVAASAVRTGAGLVSGAAHTAEHVLSDLNPF